MTERADEFNEQGEEQFSVDEALVNRLLAGAPPTEVAANDQVSDAQRALEATIAALALSTPGQPATAGDPVRQRLLARAEAEVARGGRIAPVVATSSAAALPAAVPPAAVPSAAAPSAAVPSAAVPPLAVHRGGAPQASRSTPRGRGAWWIAGLTSMAAAASLLFALRLQTERTGLQDTVAALEASQLANRQQLDSLATTLAEREQQLASVAGPDVAVVELASTASLPPTARMFWDRAADRWTFVANNLQALAADRTYALWLVTKDGQKILAGNFAPDARGVAVVRATYELPRTALAAVAVTEEPGEGVPQPTGPILLVGSAGSAPE